MPTKEQLSIIWESQFEFPETRHSDDPMYREPKSTPGKQADIIEQFLVKDRVTRKAVNNFSQDGSIGTVVEILPGDRCKIKWDVKSSTGQQHSTIQFKFLSKVN